MCLIKPLGSRSCSCWWLWWGEVWIMISRAPRESDQDLSFFTRTKIPKFCFSTKFSILLRRIFFMCHFFGQYSCNCKFERPQQKLSVLTWSIFFLHFPACNCLHFHLKVMICSFPSMHNGSVPLGKQELEFCSFKSSLSLSNWKYRYHFHFLIENTDYVIWRMLSLPNCATLFGFLQGSEVVLWTAPFHYHYIWFSYPVCDSFLKAFVGVFSWTCKIFLAIQAPKYIK